MNSYSTRRKKRKRIRNTVIAVVAAAVLVTVIMLVQQPKPVKFFTDELTRIDVPQTYTLLPYGNRYAGINRAVGELYFINAKGSRLWGYGGVTDGMALAYSEHRFATYIGDKLEVIDDEGNYLYSKTYDYPIRRLALSDNLSLILQNRGKNQYVLVLNANGDVVDTINNNGTLVSFGIYGEDNDNLWLIYIDSAGTSPCYQLLAYRYNNGIKSTTLSYTDYEQVLYKAIFLSDRIMLMGSQECIYLDTTGKVLSRIKCVGYKDSGRNYNYNGNIRILFNDAGLYNRVLCIYNKNVSFCMEEEQDIIATAVTELNYYLFTACNVITYSKETGKRTVYSVPFVISDVLSSDAQYAYLNTDDGYYRLQMQ